MRPPSYFGQGDYRYLVIDTAKRLATARARVQAGESDMHLLVERERARLIDQKCQIISHGYIRLLDELEFYFRQIDVPQNTPEP